MADGRATLLGQPGAVKSGGGLAPAGAHRDAEVVAFSVREQLPARAEKLRRLGGVEPDMAAAAHTSAAADRRHRVGCRSVA